MKHCIRLAGWILSALGSVCGAPPVRALELVSNGVAVASVVVAGHLPENRADYAEAESKTGPRRRGDEAAPGAGPDQEAAAILVAWVRKMTGAELPVVHEAPASGVAVYVGIAAMDAGLDPGRVPGATHEGVRITVEGRSVRIAGQQAAATRKAVCRFLEVFGCRVFMDGEIGEVFPRLATLSCGPMDIAERPAFRYRNPKGPNWAGPSLWKTWNGAGGEVVNHAHSWGSYVKASVFAEHPEFFAMKTNGQRTAGGWLCTSDPGLRAYFADRVAERIRAGTRHPSLSPSDGTGYCRCPACAAQDNPRAIEPSSGAASMTDRYTDFFADIGRRVGEAHPESVLSFYVYADYTQPPTRRDRLPQNLCAFIAPIRYCRFHAIGAPNCPERVQQRAMIEGWASVAQNLGYYAYMYNLAEATVPCVRMAATEKDFRYLRDKGCIALTLEMLTNWHIYGPHLHVALRLAYDPDVDARTILDDYCERFYGPGAAPFMREYWTAIDDAFARLECHSGSFHAVHLVFTPGFLARLKGLLERAAEAARGDPMHVQRVALHTEGWRSAAEYAGLREAVNAGDFREAGRIYAAFLARMDGLSRKGWANREYGTAYWRRFIGPLVQQGAQLLASPARVLVVLPDEWKLAYEADAPDLAVKAPDPAFDDSSWRTVSTYARPLNAQGLADRHEVLWYRTAFEAPGGAARRILYFAEVDGLPEVFVNGVRVECAPAGAPALKSRVPFTTDATKVLRPGRNVLAVRVDHSRITDLNLGGILRPVYLMEVSPDSAGPR